MSGAAANAAAPVLKLRHFLWVSFATLHCYSLVKDQTGVSFRRVTSTPVPLDARDEAVSERDERVARVRELLSAVGVDMSKVSQLAVFATVRDNVAAVQPTDGAARKELRVTVSPALLTPPVADDVPFDEQLRAAARTGDAALNRGQSNAVLVPAFLRHALQHHVVAQLQLSLLLIGPPVFSLLLRRRFPSAHEQSLMVANIAYLGGVLSVEQAWLPRVREQHAINTLGLSYINAALEAAELERAANRRRHAQLTEASRSTDWNTRVTARFSSIMFSHGGNYLGDLGFRTTTRIKWLTDAKQKAIEQATKPPS